MEVAHCLRGPRHRSFGGFAGGALRLMTLEHAREPLGHLAQEAGLLGTKIVALGDVCLDVE